MVDFDSALHGDVRLTDAPARGIMARDCEAEAVAAIAHALSSPVRRFVLELLVVGGATASDLYASIRDNFGVGNTRASQHLGVLARARLVEVTVDAQWRWYRLSPGAAQPLINWLRALERSC